MKKDEPLEGSAFTAWRLRYTSMSISSTRCEKVLNEKRLRLDGHVLRHFTAAYDGVAMAARGVALAWGGGGYEGPGRNICGGLAARGFKRRRSFVCGLGF